MTQAELDQLGQQLRNGWPLIGNRMRRKACQQLAAARTIETIALLAEAAASKDQVTAAIAADALCSLDRSDAVDVLCQIWADRRDERLGTLIAKKQYVATTPVKVRVLSALKASRAELVQEDEGCAGELAEAVADADKQVATNAALAVGASTHRRMIDALCRLVTGEPKGQLAMLLARAGKAPSDPNERALFLFVTGQLDRYFQEDHEFQNLRPAYERASDKVKRAVLDIVRSGDRRCLGFYSMRPKPLPDCTDHEIQTAIDSAVRHQDWRLLFQMFLELPMRYGYPLLDQFQKSGWSPSEPDLASLYREVLKIRAAAPIVPAPSVRSSVFQKWLSRAGTFSSDTTPALVSMLDHATPPVRVTVVAALSQRRDLPAGTVEKIRDSPDWLIRLAGYMTGLITDLQNAAANDPNHWIRELAGGVGVLTLWPGRTRPTDLQGLKQRLKDAHPEASLGSLGSVHRVLQLLVAYHMTAPVMEPVMIEAADDAGVFERTN